MLKETLIAAMVAGVATLGAVGAASAHKTDYKHPHKGKAGEKAHLQLDYKRNKNANRNNNRNKNRINERDFGRHADYGRKRHRDRDGYFGPYWDRPALPPYVIRQTLRARGFRKIRFRDRHLPLYVVKACKRGKRFVMGLNRWGKIMWKEPRGYCGPRRQYYYY